MPNYTANKITYTFATRGMYVVEVIFTFNPVNEMYKITCMQVFDNGEIGKLVDYPEHVSVASDYYASNYFERF